MGFNTTCDVMVQLGEPNAPPVWCWEYWPRLEALVEPVLAAISAKPSLRVAMFEGMPLKEVRLRRLAWSREDHAKWLLGSPINERRSSTWRFGWVDVWAPNPNTCSRRQCPPDFFLQIWNEACIPAPPQRSVLFNPTVLSSVSTQARPEVGAAVTQCRRELRQVLGVLFEARRERPWGGDGLYVNPVSELRVDGMFKLGDPHTRPLDLASFRPGWSSIAA